MIFHTWSGTHQQSWEGRGWLSTRMPDQKLHSHCGCMSMGLQRNWMRECLWKRKQTESLVIADMDVQDSSEPTFANVVFEVFTQPCMRHQSMSLSSLITGRCTQYWAFRQQADRSYFQGEKGFLATSSQGSLRGL